MIKIGDMVRPKKGLRVRLGRVIDIGPRHSYKGDGCRVVLVGFKIKRGKLKMLSTRKYLVRELTIIKYKPLTLKDVFRDIIKRITKISKRQ